MQKREFGIMGSDPKNGVWPSIHLYKTEASLCAVRGHYCARCL